MGLGWLEVIRTLAPVVTATIALVALKNWQRQDKAKREAEFLDALIDAAHAFIAEMSKPTSFVKMVKISMASHVPTWESGDDADKSLKGTIAYIQRNGESHSKRLGDLLADVRPLASKLRALATKGQVFGFEGYAKCQRAVAMLTWQLDRSDALAAMIHSPTMNWEHPQVRASLEAVTSLDAADIHKHLQENNIALIEFCRDTYKDIYGSHLLRLKLLKRRKPASDGNKRPGV